MTDRIGFFEESPGVRSSARLAAILLALACVAMALAIVAVAIWRTKDAAPVITAIGVPLIPLALAVFGALKARSSGGPP